MKLKKVLALMLVSSPVFAWDGVVNGKVFQIDVTHGSNYGYRVSLEGAPKLCGNDNACAYLNDGDSNYQTYVSVLLAAKMGERKITVYSYRAADTGYCHIGYISLT